MLNETEGLKDFAKTFQSKKHGQILVINGQTDDTYLPSIKFMFENEMGRLTIENVAKDDSDKSQDKIDKYFDRIDLDYAEKTVAKCSL